MILYERDDFNLWLKKCPLEYNYISLFCFNYWFIGLLFYFLFLLLLIYTKFCKKMYKIMLI